MCLLPSWQVMVVAGYLCSMEITLIMNDVSRSYLFPLLWGGKFLKSLALLEFYKVIGCLLGKRVDRTSVAWEVNKQKPSM